jgi:hypothetical protein
MQLSARPRNFLRGIAVSRRGNGSENTNPFCRFLLSYQEFGVQSPCQEMASTDGGHSLLRRFPQYLPLHREYLRFGTRSAQSIQEPFGTIVHPRRSARESRMPDSDIVYCDNCRQNVHYHYDSVNHLQQLVLSVLSLGLLLPLWLIAIFAPSKICNECGQPIWNDPTPRPLPEQGKAS